MKKVSSEYEDIRKHVVKDAREVEVYLEEIVLRPEAMVELVARAFPKAWQSYIRTQMCAKAADQGSPIFIAEALKFELWQGAALVAQTLFLVIGILVTLFGTSG
jgi:hypothetical protein